MLRFFLFGSAFVLLQLVAIINGVQANEPTSDPSVITTEPTSNSSVVTTDNGTESGSGEAMEEAEDSENSVEGWGDRPELPLIPSDLETQTDSESVIILGQPEDAPYVVAIPGNQEQLLDRVQQVIPQAFLTDSRRGRYVQAGAFSSRSEAEAVSCQLRHHGFDARVVYFRVR